MLKSKKSTYLDYNATVPVLNDVKASIIECMNSGPLNASSVHSYGRKGKNIIESSREKIATVINAKIEDIVFTSSATEATNLLFSNFTDIVVSSIEHLAVLSSSKTDFIIPVDKNGVLDLNYLDDLLKKISKDRKNILVSVMWVNNETGVVQPIADVIKVSKKYGCYVHCDAAQALGKIKIDLEKLEFDFITLSGHKIGAPAGIGALVVKSKIHLNPHLLGGGQEKGLRAGTENILGICGFGVAARILSKTKQDNFTRIKFLRDYLINKIILFSF